MATLNVPVVAQPRVARLTGLNTAPDINIGRALKAFQTGKNIRQEGELEDFLASSGGGRALAGSEAALNELIQMPGGAALAQTLQGIASTREKNKLDAAKRAISEEGQFAASIRPQNLTFKKAELIKRAQQKMKDGLRDDASELMRIAQLKSEDEINAELDQNIALAVPAETFLKNIASAQSQIPKFIGTPNRIVKEVDGKSQNFLSGIVQQPDGSFQLQEVQVDGEFADTSGVTTSQKADLARDVARATEEGRGEGKLKTARQLATEGKKGATAAEIETGIVMAANTARRTRPRIERVRRALDLVDTGKFTEAKAIFAPFVPLVDITDEQVLQSEIQSFVLDTLNQQTGTKTDFDFQKAAEASAELGKTTEANRRILDIMLENLDRAEAEESQFIEFVDNQGGDALRFQFRESASTVPGARDSQISIEVDNVQSADDLSEEQLEELVKQLEASQGQP